MTSVLRRAAVVAALALGSCSVNHYRVSMSPAPEGLHRQTACWRTDALEDVVEHETPFPSERLAKIARAYGKPPPASCEGTHVFDGVFADATPDDVGGAGLISRSTTSLGTVWRYVERFRGDPDPQADLERRFRAADRISAFLVAWFGTELEGRPGWERLRAFLEGPLRRDVKALVLFDLTAASPAVEGRKSDPFAWFSLFLVERGYARPAEIGRLRDGDTKDSLVFLQRLVARRMGLADADPVPESLAFLGEGRVEASLAAFSSSPFVQRLWAERAAETPAVLPAGPPEDRAGTLLGLLVGEDLLDLHFLEDRDVVEVSLACGVDPVETDGEWRAAEGRVVWPETAMRERGGPGLLRHATWAVPDGAAQRARFGRVVLAGEALARYVAWRAALPEGLGARWDRAIAALAPGADLARALEAIELPAEDGSDRAGPGRKILEEALEAAE